jgi:hypothetical protein
MYVCLWSPGWSTDGASAGSPERRSSNGRRGGPGVVVGPAVTAHAAPAIDRGPSPGEDLVADGPSSAADAGPFVAELAPRVRVERERIWADGRGLDAVRLAERLVDALAERGVAVRAGVAALPVAAALAAEWGTRGEAGSTIEGDPGTGPAVSGEASRVGTPFLVKERTGWGWRRASAPSPDPGPSPARPSPTSPRRGGGKGQDSPTSPVRGDGEGQGSLTSPVRGDGEGQGSPPSPGRGGGEGQGSSPGGAVVMVRRGREVEWLAGLPVSALGPSERLRSLLEGVGVSTVGALALLEREAVEVRFGSEAVPLWRLARGDDRRVLFGPVPRERPHGSIDFVEYVLTDPSRLLFTAHALLGPVCERLVARGEHARTLRLTLPLANGETWERVLRPARPTASREAWLRLVRGVFERLTVPDAVAGMGVEVGSTEEAAVQQGDLFDRGFATASAVEAAVARLGDQQLHPLTVEGEAHPLLERRAGWREAGRIDAAGEVSEAVGVGLQLLREPRRIRIETRRQRDHAVPVRILDRGRWWTIAVAAGPDRISGGQWSAESYAREYFRCVTEEGRPLWVFRDALDDGWYLHGWWD